MTVIDMIRLIAPEFNNVFDSDIEQWIEFASPFVSKKQFGKLYNQALALFVCHKMKVANLGVDENGGGMGTFADAVRFTSYSEGSRSVSFNNGGFKGNADDELRLTPYGLQFIALRRMVVVPITSSGFQPASPPILQINGLDWLYMDDAILYP